MNIPLKAAHKIYLSDIKSGKCAVRCNNYKEAVKAYSMLHDASVPISALDYNINFVVADCKDIIFKQYKDVYQLGYRIIEFHQICQ